MFIHSFFTTCEESILIELWPWQHHLKSLNKLNHSCVQGGHKCKHLRVAFTEMDHFWAVAVSFELSINLFVVLSGICLLFVCLPLFCLLFVELRVCYEVFHSHGLSIFIYSYLFSLWLYDTHTHTHTYIYIYTSWPGELRTA